MDIISPPDYLIEDVIDLFIMVPSGPCQFTLREGDSWGVTDAAILVHWNKQAMVFNLARVDYYYSQPRTIKTQVKKAPARDIPSVDTPMPATDLR